MTTGTYTGTKLYLADSIADPAAPTAAEMGSATALEDVTADGFGVNPTRNMSSTPMLETGHIRQSPGSWGDTLTLKFTHEVGAADTQRALFPFSTDKYLVRSRNGAGTTAGDVVDVYKVQAHEPEDFATEQDADQMWQVQLGVQAPPEIDVEVVA